MPAEGGNAGDIVAKLKKELEACRNDSTASSSDGTPSRLSSGKTVRVGGDRGTPRGKFDPVAYTAKMQEKKEAAKHAKLERRLEEEMKECTFNPSVSRKSQQLLEEKSRESANSSKNSSSGMATPEKSRKSSRDASLPIHERLIKAGEETKKRREQEIEERAKQVQSTAPLSPYVSENSEKIVRRKNMSPNDAFTRLTEEDVARRREKQLAMEEQAEEELRRQTQVKSHMSKSSRLIAERLEAEGLSSKDRIMSGTRSREEHVIAKKSEVKPARPNDHKDGRTTLVTTMAFAPVGVAASPGSPTGARVLRSAMGDIGAGSFVESPVNSTSCSPLTRSPLHSQPGSPLRGPSGAPRHSKSTNDLGRSLLQSSISSGMSGMGGSFSDRMGQSALFETLSRPRQGGKISPPKDRGGGSPENENGIMVQALLKKCSNLEVELSKMQVAAKEEEERMHELEEAKLEAEEAQLALEENRFEVLQLREELAAAKAQAKAQDEPGCDVAALQKEVEELRAEKERLAAETAAAKERDRRSRKDLESMTEKSQAVVRLNAQLMTQVKQLKASNAAAGSE